MTTFSQSLHIPAPSEVAWAILADLENWPQWTPSMTSVQPLGTGPVGLGARFRVKQPRLSPATMTVSEWEPGVRFTWFSTGSLVRAVAEHRLVPTEGGCTLHLDLVFEGPLSGLARVMAARLVRRYLQMEAEGLRDASVRRVAGATG